MLNTRPFASHDIRHDSAKTPHLNQPFKQVFCNPEMARAVMALDISCQAKLVYLFMALSAGKKSHCWPSQEYLAEKLNMGLRTIQRAVKELAQFGLIDIQRPQGRENIYYLRQHSALNSVQEMRDIAGICPNETDLAGTRSSQTRIADMRGLSDEEIEARQTEEWYFNGEIDMGFWSENPETETPNIHAKMTHTHANLAHEAGSPANTPAYLAALNISKYTKNTPPYPPRRQLGSRPVRQRGERVDFFSRHELEAQKSADAAFEQVWNLWPVKQDKKRASEVWNRLWFAGELPKFEILLEKIHLLQREDRWWRNGKTPLLTKWLNGARWHDEPVPALAAETAPARTNSTEMQENNVFTPRKNAQKAAAAQFIQELHEREAEQNKVKNEEALRSFVEQYSLPENDPRKNKFMRFYPEHIRASLEQKARTAGLL